MVHSSKDMASEERVAMRGGAGSVRISHLEKDSLPPNGRLFAKLVIGPGSSIGLHEHQGEAELFYFASGEGFVIDDGVRVPVKAGDSMTTQSGHSHSVENTGSDDLVVIAAIITG